MSDVATNKQIMTEYFQEWMDSIKEKAERVVEAKKELKKNEDYQKLLKERKALNDKIKAIEDANQNNIEAKKLTENIKMIKDSISDSCDIEKSIVGKVFGFFRTKFEKQKDELAEISEIWVELFEEE